MIDAKSILKVIDDNSELLGSVTFPGYLPTEGEVSITRGDVCQYWAGNKDDYQEGAVRINDQYGQLYHQRDVEPSDICYVAGDRYIVIFSEERGISSVIDTYMDYETEEEYPGMLFCDIRGNTFAIDKVGEFYARVEFYKETLHSCIEFPYSEIKPSYVYLSKGESKDSILSVITGEGVDIDVTKINSNMFERINDLFLDNVYDKIRYYSKDESGVSFYSVHNSRVVAMQTDDITYILGNFVNGAVKVYTKSTELYLRKPEDDIVRVFDSRLFVLHDLRSNAAGAYVSGGFRYRIEDHIMLEISHDKEELVVNLSSSTEDWKVARAYSLTERFSVDEVMEFISDTLIRFSKGSHEWMYGINDSESEEILDTTDIPFY